MKSSLPFRDLYNEFDKLPKCLIARILVKYYQAMRRWQLIEIVFFANDIDALASSITITNGVSELLPQVGTA